MRSRKILGRKISKDARAFFSGRLGGLDAAAQQPVTHRERKRAVGIVESCGGGNAAHAVEKIIQKCLLNVLCAQTRTHSFSGRKVRHFLELNSVFHNSSQDAQFAEMLRVYRFSRQIADALTKP